MRSERTAAQQQLGGGSLAHFSSCAVCCVLIVLCRRRCRWVLAALPASLPPLDAAASEFASVFVCVRFSAHLSSSWVNTQGSSNNKGSSGNNSNSQAPRLHNTAARRRPICLLFSLSSLSLVGHSLPTHLSRSLLLAFNSNTLLQK